MNGLLDWFAKKAQQKLRLSQIRILYQNDAALDFLQFEFDTLDKLGLLTNKEIPQSLIAFRGVVDDLLITLTYSDVLSDSDSARLLQINNVLKDLYTNYLEGKRAFRKITGGANDGLMNFADRFMPAGGWKNFSDKEWDRIVSGAVRRLER